MNTELVIIGGGPAGYHCALQCARQGLKPVLIEKEALGGTGLRWGCLPVKYIMDRIRAHKTRRGFWRGGIAGEESLASGVAETILTDSRKTMAAVSEAMEEQLTAAGVTLLYGDPELLGPQRVQLGDETITFRRLVLATGTEANPPTGVRLDGKRIISHREAVVITEPPASLLILGGDVEGLEFASLFSELGSRVTVLEMQPDLLAGTDPDLTAPLFRRLEANGVALNTATQVATVKTVDNGVEVQAVDGRLYEAELALVAMTRRPVLPAGLEKTGLSLVDGRIPVNDDCQTTVDHIYCIGDLNGRMEMGHTGIQQGVLLADHFNRGTAITWRYAPLPRAMFTLPQNGGAGEQEQELKAAGIPYRKAQVRWADTWRGMGQAEPEGFVKVLAHENGTLLGIWMTGYEISEQVGLAGMLIDEKRTVDELKQQLWVHPTLSEALHMALLQLS
ncbi:dihydrolipoyl dehydrogenase family protein [Anoxynatronum buryatiense]|uniref:Dihydrolipoamide dehydrogenase n=1 Tax=Anoxynatronum buryatiense TaxID=489973 RepID=A0AA45WVS6_9CLOT|nr:NAD(P)/FAD-dependent oxidoreductase [Anoxynatronum buryatiense]SMP54944.1 dihydrolipoamide dehydrogenase [Anoxynatronum buryatiense]